MLNLNQLRVFHEVAKSGSFTAAARVMGISQPAVSMQVRNFQEGLGVTLYRLDGREFVLTEFGREIMAYAARIFSVAAEAEAYLQSLKIARLKFIMISTTRTIATYFLPRVMSVFKALHRNLEIRLDICGSDEAFEAVVDGRSDFAFVVDPPNHASLSRKTLFNDALILIAQSPSAFTHAILEFDFTDVVLISREPGSKTRSAMERGLSKAGAKLGQVLELADVEAIKSSVRAGVGVSIIPALSAREELDAGLLFARPFLGGEVKLRFDVVYRRGESSPITRAFLSALLQTNKPLI